MLHCCFIVCRSRLGCCEPGADSLNQKQQDKTAAKAKAAGQAAAKKKSKKSAAKPVTAHVASFGSSKGIFPRMGHTECVWVTHPLDAVIPISKHVVQTGYATGTW